MRKGRKGGKRKRKKKNETKNSGNEGNAALQLSSGQILKNLQALFQRPLFDLWLDLSASNGTQYLLQLRPSAPGAHLDGYILHRDSNEGEGDFAGRKTDDLNEAADPDSLERAPEALGVANDVDDGIENEIVLFDEGVKFFGLASVVGSDLQGGLDTDVSDIGDNDVLHADDVLRDLDRVKTETPGTDDEDCLFGSEFGARNKGVVGSEDGVCGDGGGRWLHGLLVGGDLNKVPGGDRNVGGKETITTESEVRVVKAGVIETVQASTTRFGVASVGSK